MEHKPVMCSTYKNRIGVIRQSNGNPQQHTRFVDLHNLRQKPQVLILIGTQCDTMGNTVDMEANKNKLKASNDALSLLICRGNI